MALRNLTKKFVEMRTAAKASKGLGITFHEEESGDHGLLKVSSRPRCPYWMQLMPVVLV